MEFRPLSPEFSYVSGKIWPSNGKHTCGGAESRTEDICGIIVYKWKDSPAEEYD